ncbi:hypothetical protein N8A45_001377 [Neisseria gonorrhoeae]
MKNKTSSLPLWLAAIMLAARSPSKEDKTKENGASAPDNVKQAESAPL